MDSLMEEIERIFRQSQDENWSYEEECGENLFYYKGGDIFTESVFAWISHILPNGGDDCYMGFIKEGREMAAYGEKNRDGNP